MQLMTHWVTSELAASTEIDAEEVVVMFIIACLSPSLSLGVVRVLVVEVTHRKQGTSCSRSKNVTTFGK